MAEEGRKPDQTVSRSIVVAGTVASTGLFALYSKKWAGKALRKEVSSALEKIEAAGHENAPRTQYFVNRAIKLIGDQTDAQRGLQSQFISHLRQSRSSIDGGHWSDEKFNRAFAQLYAHVSSAGYSPRAQHAIMGTFSSAVKDHQRHVLLRNFARGLGKDLQPDLSYGQAMGVTMARSPVMKWFVKGAELFKPLQLVDELGGLRLLRESFNPEQLRYIGQAKDLAMFARGVPEGLATDGHVFYGYGRLFAQTSDGEISQLAGRYSLYGRAGAGQTRSIMENVVDELVGRTTDIRRLHAQVKPLNKKITGLEQEALKRQLTPREKHDLRNWQDMKRSLDLQIKALRTHGKIAGFRRFMDVGFNKRGHSPLTARYWKDNWENFFRVFNPSEEHPTTTRELDMTMPYDVIKSFDPTNLKDWRDVFLGGRKHGVNTGTFVLHHMFKRINDSVAYSPLTSWMAMSGLSATSPAAYVGNMMLKRALPLYAAGFYAQYLNDEVGRYTGERANDRAQDASDRLSLRWARWKDRHGWSQRARHLDKLSGGVLGYMAHPFVDAPVGLNEQELAQRQQTGYVPVRKGRWWLFGSSTAFRGDRVQYYAPVAHRFARAGDIYKSDTLYGSADEYYANAALPTFEHPLAPFRHFVTDRYHYERKHYHDRPYPVSAPLFEPTTLHGVLLNPLLGWLVKPAQYMHQDEMPYIMRGPHRGEVNPKYTGMLTAINEQIKAQADARELTGFVTPSGQITPMQAVPLPGSHRQVAQINEETYQEAAEQDAGYPQGLGTYSASGANAVAPYGSGKHKMRQHVREMNHLVKHGVAKRFTKGRMLETMPPPGLFTGMDPNDPRNRAQVISPNDPRYLAGLAYYSATEIGGIYGFGMVSLTGDVMASRPMLANAGRMTGFERTYWDRWNSGGMLPTPALSESFRRFMPHRYHSNTEYNPIRNTMPTWLPGSGGEDPGYFVDFLHGDPYTAVPNGEARLPGRAYEMLYGIPDADLSIRKTQLGYTPEVLYGFLTGQHEPFAAYSEEIAERGGALHQEQLARLRHEHRLLADNVAFHDPRNGVQGSIDAIVSSEKGKAIAEIHTLSHQRFGKLGKEGDPRYLAQINYEMGTLGIHQGQLIYVDRETGATRTIDVGFSQARMNQTLRDLHRVRDRIQREIRNGQWGPGQFYSDLTKFRILGDVAPWSQQYKRYRDYLTHLDEGELSDAERAQIQEIKHQVSQRKKRFTMTPYRLKYSDLIYQRVRVKDVIDANTFTTYEHPDNPIRLAGVHINADGSMWVQHYIHRGAHLTIGIAADPTQQIARDTLHTMRATVTDGKGRMINRLAIQDGVGTETEEQSPAALHVHYSQQEIRWGKLLESFGHAPIPFFHNKFMPIDSPLDLYKRTQVYGKDWQDWRHPFKDYIFPSFESFAQQGWMGYAGAVFLGASLGIGVKGKAILSATGVAATFGMHLYREGHPLPHYREREREIDEYFDILKYVKYEGLYEHTRDWIKRHQGHDIGLIADKYAREGEARKRRIQVLKAEKRRIIVEGRQVKDHERLLEIEHELRQLQSYRAELNLTREDVLALQYRDMAQSTLYGADSHGNLSKIMLALDPKQREFFQAFLHAPGPERKEILRVVPSNQRRFLEAAWGMQAEEKQKLSDYFKSHYLPSENWDGWRADSSLDDYKLLAYKDAKLDMTSHGFWPQDEQRVKEEELWDLMPNRPTDGNIRERLHQTLAGLGLTNVDVQLQPNGSSSHQVHLHVRHSRKDQTSQRAA